MSEAVYTQRRHALVKSLIAQGVLRSPNIVRAMETVPREKFVPNNYRDSAYADTPLPIGFRQTVSAPHMVAIMAEAMELEEGLKVLEVGSGCGYNAALLCEIVAPDCSTHPGHVYTVEIIPGLFELCRQRVQELGYSGRVAVILGDGSLGHPQEALYDRIVVTASAPRILPSLLEQLAKPGIMLSPIGPAFYVQELIKIRKDELGQVESSSIGDVAFVPLVGKEGWKGHGLEV